MADATVRGEFVWHDLLTPNAAGAHEFYRKAVGWKTQPWERDPSYVMFAAPSGPIGGVDGSARRDAALGVATSARPTSTPPSRPQPRLGAARA